MRSEFSPSVNLVRDDGADHGYIVTENARQTAKEIVQSEGSGMHAFQLIGSYGTGKSAFLLALMNALRGKETGLPVKTGKRPPHIIALTGEYRSLQDFLADWLDLKKDHKGFQHVLDALHQRYEQYGRLYLIIDEFGKFLEYAAKHDPEKEMYFIQQLAEFVNKEDRNITLLITLHQGVDAYWRGLTPAQRNEWKKVQGRFRELPFNEPISQLVHLAAQQLSNRGTPLPKGIDPGLMAKLISTHRLFDDGVSAWTKADLSELYPLDLIAAHTLTKALQTCGQNSRSLFTFLRTSAIGTFKGGTYFGIPQVFDHLNSEFYSFLRGAGNPARRHWEMVWFALERVDAEFGRDRRPYEDIIKVVGALQLFGGQGAMVDGKFLASYLGTVNDIKNVAKRLQELEARRILRFVKHRVSYRLTEGTDLDFETALNEASQQVDDIADLVGKLQQHFRRQYVLAKEVTYRNGSPRVFEYRLSDKPITDRPKGMVDGYINLVFASKPSTALKVSEEAQDPIVYGVFTNTDRIRQSLLAIEQAQSVIEKNADDRVAVKELRNIQQHHETLLDHYMHEALFSGQRDGVRWFHSGKEQKQVKDGRSFNRLLSQIVRTAYPQAPAFRNELINREKVSPTASTARKNLFDRVCDQWMEPDLGFADGEFPAERAIYTTLLKENGMHRKSADGYDLFPPDTDSSFMAVWQECERFLADSKHGRKDVSELMERLGERPFKLKYGLVELWVPLFLFIKRGDYALYQNNAFIPQLTGPVLYMMTRQPREFQVKAFALDEVRQRLFKRYKAFLGKEEVEHLTNGDLIDITRPFLSFYRNLSPYAQNTDRIGPEAKDLREAIKQATDPEKTFFEDLPKAMRLSLEEAGGSDEQLGRFIGVLSSSLDQLQQATARLAERIDTFIGEVVLGTGERFPKTRQELASRLEGIREHQLLDHLTPLYKRTIVPLDQCEAWIASIAQGAIGKPIDRFTDRDEEVLKERLSAHYRELMGLADVHRTEKDADGAPVLRMQITTSRKGTRTEMIHYPAKQRKKVEEQVRVLKSKLDDDPAIRRAVLAWLLNDELDKA